MICLLLISFRGNKKGKNYSLLVKWRRNKFATKNIRNTLSLKKNDTVSPRASAQSPSSENQLKIELRSLLDSFYENDDLALHV